MPDREGMSLSVEAARLVARRPHVHIGDTSQGHVPDKGSDATPPRVHRESGAPESGVRQITPVILCGGAGTRLWPLSRSLRPKQLLNLLGEDSLLQETAQRLSGSSLFAAPVVVCNEAHRFLVADQLRDLDIAPALIVLEPVPRNTAPAIAVAALLSKPSDLLLVVPSDAFVADEPGYLTSIELARRAAEDGWLVTFGVEPLRPETGYGYIREGKDEVAPHVRRIDGFHEKPDAVHAQAYLAGGHYLWNAGMFLFRADRYLQELEQYAGDIVATVSSAISGASRDLDFTFLDADVFRRAQSISIDRALLERTDRAAVVRLKSTWSDVGSWQELWRVSASDVDGNVLVGNVIAEESRGSYIHTDGCLVATLGLQDHVVVATKDVVMVVPQERSQDVRRLVECVAQAGRTEHEAHPRVYRPWGYYEGIDHGPGFQVKRIMVKPGGRLSLQRHAHRAEHWTIVHGMARVTIDQRVFDLRANQSAHVPLGAIHRLENLTSEPLYMIEVQCGDYLGEDDIERLEDVYHRNSG